MQADLKEIDDQARAEARQAAIAAGPRAKIEDREELVRYLEDVAGRPFYTREELRDYLTELRTEGKKARQSSKIGRQGVFLVALILAFLQYQIIDIFTQVSSLRGSSVVPVRAAGYRS